jgi:DNA repair exonuclease SbcCD ATPase subunit
MLRISFHQFRCWENLIIEAPVGKITLIKGNSGVGKTTILQGITWCLYGNIRLVAPNHLEKAKTYVTIELPYNLNGVNGLLTINRQKNPNRLIISHMDNIYEDKVAQSIIDDLFGNYDIWLASCYIGQGCRNNFLTAPNTGKMELLNSIAFHEEDPTLYIEKIDSSITDTDADYQRKLSIFTSHLNSFQTFVSTVDITKALTFSQISNINIQIEALSKQDLNLRALDRQRTIDIGILDNIQKQLAAISSTSITLPPPEDSLITMNNKYQGGSLETSESIEANINRAVNMIPILQRRDDLESAIQKIHNLLLPYVTIDQYTPTFTTNDYQDAISRETAIRDNQRIAQSLNVPYSDIAIKESIQLYQLTLSSQSRLKLEHERNMLQTKIENLELEQSRQVTPIVLPDINPQEISIPDYSKYSTKTLADDLNELSKQHGAIQAHIEHLVKGCDVILCPQCKCSLRYQGRTLVSADIKPTDSNEITIAQQQLCSVTTQIKKVNNNIQNLIMAEATERSTYERAIMLEQRRIDLLREKSKQLELAEQRRDIAVQARKLEISDVRNNLQKITDSLTLLPEVIGNVKLLTPKDIEQTHSIIGKLSNINIISQPKFSSQQIQSYLTYQDLLQKKELAISAKNQHLETIPLVFLTESVRNINSYVDKLRGYWNMIRHVSNEKSRIDHLRTSLQAQIVTFSSKICPDVTEEIISVGNSIKNLRNDLALSVEAHKANDLHEQVTKEREEVVTVNTNLSDLQTLRQHAVETECRILQQVVDSINSSIQGVCTTLFDRDINITLSLFKTLKSTKNVKPVVNFAISYQGGVFDNINQMSGGEGDRASLALTLALNRLSSCPILMLDESLSSLDLNMKEAAIRTIRENTNNTVLIIMHDGVEGVFSHVIDVESFREGRY